jgi:hypothetical protein
MTPGIAPLGISVHDHVIVGRNGHASMKGMGLIQTERGRLAARDHPARRYP